MYENFINFFRLEIVHLLQYLNSRQDDSANTQQEKKEKDVDALYTFCTFGAESGT